MCGLIFLLKKIENTDRNEEALNVIAETKRAGFDIRDNAELLHDYTAENKQ